MSRYSDIYRAGRLSQALANLNARRTNPPPPQINSRGARGAQTTIYLSPFSYDIAIATLLEQKNNSDSWNALNTLFATANEASAVTTLGANTAVSRRGFSAAAMVVNRSATRNVQVTTSDLTGLQYLKYNTDRLSLKFGRGAADDDEEDAFNALRAAYLAANTNFEINRVSWKREKVAR